MHRIGWVYMQDWDVDVQDWGFTLYICRIGIESALEVYGIRFHIHGIGLGDLWDWLQGYMGSALEMYGIRLYIYAGSGMQTYRIRELMGDWHGVGWVGQDQG